jgi:hypothetical protein
MKRGARFLVICLFASSALWAQSGQNSSQSAPQGQSGQQNEPPTLGPRPGPPGVGSGPLTSTTTDLKKLMRIHTLYIENIDNSLSDKLVQALGKMGRFRLVTKQKDADATLRGSCLESRRLKHVHTEVFISDRGGASVWQDTIYRPYNPPTLDQAVSDTATLVVAHLEQTVREAERR